MQHLLNITYIEILSCFYQEKAKKVLKQSLFIQKVYTIHYFFIWVFSCDTTTTGSPPPPEKLISTVCESSLNDAQLSWLPSRKLRPRERTARPRPRSGTSLAWALSSAWEADGGQYFNAGACSHTHTHTRGTRKATGCRHWDVSRLPRLYILHSWSIRKYTLLAVSDKSGNTSRLGSQKLKKWGIWFKLNLSLKA